MDEHPLLEASEWMESKDCEGWARLVWGVQEWELRYRCLQLLHLALSFLSLKSAMQQTERVDMRQTHATGPNVTFPFSPSYGDCSRNSILVWKHDLIYGRRTEKPLHEGASIRRKKKREMYSSRHAYAIFWKDSQQGNNESSSSSDKHFVAVCVCVTLCV